MRTADLDFLNDPTRLTSDGVVQAAENDLGTPPAILWIPMYPWMLNEKEKGITESDLYDFCRKYMDELEIYCDPEEMELEYYS